MDKKKSMKNANKGTNANANKGTGNMFDKFLDF